MRVRNCAPQLRCEVHSCNKQSLRVYICAYKARVFNKQLGIYLPVFTQVCPHARPVPSAHQHMIGEVINPGHLACKLAGRRVIVVPQVRDNVVEAQHFVSLVRIFQSHIKRYLCPADSRAQFSGSLSPRCAHYSGIPELSKISSIPWWPPRTRWSRFARRSPRPRLPRPTWLALSSLNKAGGRNGAQVLHDLQSRGARFGVVRVTDHPTGAHHLVVRIGLRGLD